MLTSALQEGGSPKKGANSKIQIGTLRSGTGQYLVPPRRTKEAWAQVRALDQTKKAPDDTGALSRGRKIDQYFATTGPAK